MLPRDIQDTVRRIATAAGWDQRVQEIRRIPERHGREDQPVVYAAVAEQLYRPHLSSAFAFVPVREDYEPESFARAYREASAGTRGFAQVDIERLAAVLVATPEAALVFRTIVGYTSNELSVATREVAKPVGAKGLSAARLKGMERGRRVSPAAARILAETIDRLISRSLWGEAPEGLKTKLDKVDTAEGWSSVRRLASEGVPYGDFLHQRHVGGAFRQLLDAASEQRGEMLERAVEELLSDHAVPYVRTGSSDQGEIAARFNVTVRPAPDFVIFEPPDTLRALLECKLTNDGGTARDKANRFESLRAESMRLGGVPVFALLDGLGWKRLNDALGPVVAHCDGRVFTLETLPELLGVQPFPGLSGKAAV